MSEGSLVARRSDFDGVMNDEDISNVDVNKRMLKFVNNAHSKYVKELEKQKEKQTSSEKKRAGERKIINEQFLEVLIQMSFLQSFLSTAKGIPVL